MFTSIPLPSAPFCICYFSIIVFAHLQYLYEFYLRGGICICWYLSPVLYFIMQRLYINNNTPVWPFWCGHSGQIEKENNGLVPGLRQKVARGSLLKKFGALNLKQISQPKMNYIKDADFLMVWEGTVSKNKSVGGEKWKRRSNNCC